MCVAGKDAVDCKNYESFKFLSLTVSLRLTSNAELKTSLMNFSFLDRGTVVGDGESYIYLPKSHMNSVIDRCVVSLS